MRGKINVYTCVKGHKTVTIDTDEGTTPMMLGCRQKDDDGKHNCTQYAKSAWYNCDQSLKPEYEWYRPETTKGLNPAEKDHVSQGGLLLRKLKS